jgi:DNA-directed RNA polymerase beta subunit
MAYLDHQEAYEDFKQSVLEGIKSHFPVVGSMQTVELKGLDVKDLEPDSDDIHGQHEAKVSGGTWASPVFANLILKDNKTGKVIQEKRMRIAEVPRVTNRYSYIVDGQEYQVDSQWQLKPGVYTRRMANGELESRFNTPTKKEFKILFDPATKEFVMNRGKSKKIPVYPLMKALGVDDDTLEQKWGKEIFAANKQTRGSSGALVKFYKSDRKGDPADHTEALKYFQDTMSQSELR